MSSIASGRSLRRRTDWSSGTSAAPGPVWCACEVRTGVGGGDTNREERGRRLLATPSSGSLTAPTIEIMARMDFEKAAKVARARSHGTDRVEPGRDQRTAAPPASKSSLAPNPAGGSAANLAANGHKCGHWAIDKRLAALDFRGCPASGSRSSTARRMMWRSQRALIRSMRSRISSPALASTKGTGLRSTIPAT